jgi:hypothetical protein
VSEAPPRLLDSGQRRRKAWHAAGIAALLAVAALTDPVRPLPFEVCLIHRLTGVPCPTCGMTRAVCQAVHGRWADSVASHPAGVLVAAGFFAWMLWAGAEGWRGRLLAETWRRRATRVLVVVIAVVSLANWIHVLAAR